MGITGSLFTSGAMDKLIGGLGLGSVNDISDGIMSVFGMGPEDRGSVLSRASRLMQPRLQAIIQIYESRGIQSAIAKIDEEIASDTRKRSGFKSSNSKAGATQNIKQFNEMKDALVGEARKGNINGQVRPTKGTGGNSPPFTAGNINRGIPNDGVQTVQNPKSSNTIMYVVLGALAFLLTRKKF